MRKLRLNWLLLVGVILALVLQVQGAVAPKTFQLTILHSNDFHGANLPSLARQATLIKEIRAKEANVIVLNGGDVFTRGSYHRNFYGQLEFDVLNAMQTDVMTLGNNEFKATGDLTAQQYLYARINQAKFPVLCANVLLEKDGSYLPNVKPYIVKKISEMRIGILGVSANRIQEYAQVKGFIVQDQIEAAKKIFPKVAAESDIVIALTHIGYQPDRVLAEAVPGLAVIVGADSHTLLKEPVTVGKIPIVQAGENGEYLGRLDLNFEYSGKAWVLKSFQGKVIKLDNTIKEDPEIKAIIDRYLATLQKKAA
ncbi:MAG TPA: metallophosphatase [Bacillota bacterium]|nr:metallophosphatase [Bacillota bacterium]